jgi:hypothetical protein
MHSRLAKTDYLGCAYLFYVKTHGNRACATLPQPNSPEMKSAIVISDGNQRMASSNGYGTDTAWHKPSLISYVEAQVTVWSF